MHITELDVDVLPRTTRQNTADVSTVAAGTAESNPYTAGLPKEMQRALAKRYAELFEVSVNTATLLAELPSGELPTEIHGSTISRLAGVRIIRSCLTGKGSRSWRSRLC